jgi:hypothetical protein
VQNGFRRLELRTIASRAIMAVIAKTIGNGRRATLDRAGMDMTTRVAGNRRGAGFGADAAPAAMAGLSQAAVRNQVWRSADVPLTAPVIDGSSRALVRPGPRPARSGTGRSGIPAEGARAPDGLTRLRTAVTRLQARDVTG